MKPTNSIEHLNELKAVMMDSYCISDCKDCIWNLEQPFGDSICMQNELMSVVFKKTMTDKTKEDTTC